MLVVSGAHAVVIQRWRPRRDATKLAAQGWQLADEVDVELVAARLGHAFKGGLAGRASLQGGRRGHKARCPRSQLSSCAQVALPTTRAAA